MSAEQQAIRVVVGRASDVDAPAAGPRLLEPANGSSPPPIDIHEEADALILEADIPGATEKTVEVQLEENVLTLHARVDSAVPRGARLLHEEYRVGAFYRSFILSDEIERSRITAEMHQGVLRLTLPKASRIQTRRIEVRTQPNP
jgi:HSP20 family molecular chaperone IbpA